MTISEASTPTVIRESDAIYESVRAICHANHAYPAPTVYRVLGNLKGAAGPMLAQALEQLARGLERSLSEYDVYEDDGGDPVGPASSAAAHMLEAAELAARMGECLVKAQNAIAGQGYRETPTA